MANDALATYLNDHLAGSVAALELLAHLEAAAAGTSDAPVLARLRADIEIDRQTLEGLMTQLDIGPSRPRLAAAWLTEKLSELKLRLDDVAGNDVRWLEGLEAVSLGIEGKRALWQALAAAAEDDHELRRLDYSDLAGLAAEQRRRVETLRLQAARSVLTA